jgi:hypothetical protein
MLNRLTAPNRPRARPRHPAQLPDAIAAVMTDPVMIDPVAIDPVVTARIVVKKAAAGAPGGDGIVAVDFPIPSTLPKSRARRGFPSPRLRLNPLRLGRLPRQLPK